jgi:AcrR family transcriptional regulator
MSTSRRKKPTYHHGDLSAALLKAAAELLEEQGLAGVTLREVARRAGVSHNAPYRHFPDLQSLLAALAADGFRMFDARVGGTAGATMGESYLAFALEHPERFRLMFSGPLFYRDHPGLRDAALRSYEGLVSAFRARSDLPDPEAAAAAAWSMVHGLAQLLLGGHFARVRGGASMEAFAKRVLGAVRFAGSAPRQA